MNLISLCSTDHMLKKILSKSNLFLFLSAIGSSILITGTAFLIVYFFGEKAKPFLYAFIPLGIIPNLLLLIVIFRIIKSVSKEAFTLISFFFTLMKNLILHIFSDKNLNKVETVFKENKPKIEKVMKDMDIKKKETSIFWIAPIIALVIGLLPLPIGYFMISRLIVSGCALYFVVNFYKKNINFKVWIFGFIVVLYNPLIPIYLNEKFLWIIVNIPTMYYFYINRKIATA